MSIAKLQAVVHEMDRNCMLRIVLTQNFMLRIRCKSVFECATRWPGDCKLKFRETKSLVQQLEAPYAVIGLQFSFIDEDIHED